LLLVLSGNQCIHNTNPCLTIPTTDSTPPTAGMIIEYYQNGMSKNMTLSATDASITINADESKPVTILYSGGDNEGLKKLNIDYTEHRQTGGIGQTGNPEVQPITCSCPKAILMGTFTFDKNGGSRGITISVRSENWLGMITWTQQHHIIIQ